MTAQPTFSEFLANTVSACLYDPGHIMSKLYRSDGITQNTPIEQLFANYYRSEPYEYTIITPHEDNLIAIEQYLTDNMDVFENHIEENHTNCDLYAKCGSNCIVKILKVIKEAIKEYAERIKISFAEESEEQIIDQLISINNSYNSFIVVMENKIPSITRILEKIPTEDFPYSLWKFLYNQFLEYLIKPLKNQIIQILMKGIEKERASAIEKAINGSSTNSFNFTEFDNVCKLRGLAEILSTLLLDEKSVHYLQSSSYYTDDDCDPVETELKVQTSSLYRKYYNSLIDKQIFEKALIDDVATLERLLLPSQMKKSAENCANIARSLWGVNKIRLEEKFESYNLTDARVEVYIKRLGLEE